MDELLEQFLIEGRELVQQASDDLLALERNATDAGSLDSVFRAVHTLKGSVGLFDLAPMGTMLHAAEDLLSAVRDGRLAAERTTIDALLDCIGASEAWLEIIARTEKLPPDATARSARLTAAMWAVLADDEGSVDDPPRSTDLAWLDALLARDPGAVAKARAAGHIPIGVRYTPHPDCFFRGDDPISLVRSVPDLFLLHIDGREPWSLDEFDPFVCNLAIELLSTAPLAEIQRIFRPTRDQSIIADASDAARPPSDSHANTLRVDAARIDAMVDGVGELIVAKNALAHLAARAAEIDPGLGRALSASQADIDRLVGNMHRAVMGTRMIPLSRTFRRLPRLVREIAGRLEKEVRFEVAGAEIEADRTVVDGLHEPLVHLLRNAVDHGIERADTRRAAGKPPVGLITLRAEREAERLIVTVEDDGAGIDRAKVRETARTRGLLSDAVLAAMDDDAVAKLIFTPGFSTAARITDVSGRGVGMDAVHMAAETLGGRASVTSKLGIGSTFSMILPQGVYLSTIVVASVGAERFGVPIGIVEETARIPADHILWIRDGAAFVWRDRTIPLVRLSDLLNLSARASTLDAKVLIVTIGDQRLGIAVEGVGERLDVLLRPMRGLLSGVPGLLGATLMGDGNVLIVLNLPELIG